MSRTLYHAYTSVGLLHDLRGHGLGHGVIGRESYAKAVRPHHITDVYTWHIHIHTMVNLLVVPYGGHSTH